MAAWIGAILAGALAYWIYPRLRARDIIPLDAVQKVAFVAAAFSVTAYNLRTRVVDLILKVNVNPTRTRVLTAIARDCGKRLTGLVIHFTLTALVMCAGAFVPKDSRFAAFAFTFCGALFASACISFVYIVFAFETLEEFALDQHEEASKRLEADRLLKPKS